jgi:transglutaminase-like putative cysteine protease
LVSALTSSAGRRLTRGRGSLIAALLASAWLAAGAVFAADETLLARVVAGIDAGQFAVADRLIAAALNEQELETGAQAALEFQRERMRRILLDFSLEEPEVKARVRRQIPDLTDAEFSRWAERGYLERRLIDGRLLYFSRSASNLFRLSEEARARRSVQAPFTDSPMETPNAYHRQVRAAALSQEATSVEPRRLSITQSLTVDADAVPAGETVRAWIPYPRGIPGQQEEIRFVGSEPANGRIAPESTLQRTVYLEKRAERGEATEFEVRYELTIFGQYHKVEADHVMPAEITPELEPYVAERPPHVVFTNAMRLFSRQVVGDERNPWRIAEKLFTAVDRIPWAGAREYSTITNISDHALHAGHADCGQQTLLLITLLRLNGIPARWQSGMMFSEGDYWNLHDWGALYVEPYGWVPMDVTFGRFEGAPDIEWFYLGGLDGWRIAFNDDFGTRFDPPKRHFRSETVDSQRGEVEWDGGNLYFDQWDYSFDAEVVPASSATYPKPTSRPAERPDLSRRGT